MGVTKEVLAEGGGATPAKGDTVTVHCTGYGKDRDLSKKFWSTKDPGQEPFAFQVGLGRVIKGWDEGVLGMKLGEKARLTCSPDYAYGAGGFPAWGYPFHRVVFRFRCHVGVCILVICLLNMLCLWRCRLHDPAQLDAGVRDRGAQDRVSVGAAQG